MTVAEGTIEADDAYARHRERARDRQRLLSKAGRDIGRPPPVKDPARREAACESLLQFKKSYFPARFKMAFSQDQLKVTERFQEAISEGGIYALAMPRGSGKTTETIVAVLWATMTGRSKMTIPIGSSRERALGIIKGVKNELRSNKLLLEDFPEVCFPIKELENRANRCLGQHIDGESTNIVWSSEKVVLPTVKDSVASGAVIYVFGIRGGIRGLLEGNVRPDLVIPDDVQKRGSAKSLMQCTEILQILNGDVMGLAGPGEKFTVIMPCTVIFKGDVADTCLDREKSPLWTGEKYKMVYNFPTNMKLWDEYSLVRADDFRNGGDGSKGNEFYLEYREAMDAGAVVAWLENFKANEHSAIQHAMNLFYADPGSFFSEYQNDPMDETTGGEQLDAAKLGKRLNGRLRGEVPEKFSHVTAFIDVQKSILFWAIVAWSDDFSGAVIDYNSWPDQRRRDFLLTDKLHVTLQTETPGAGIEGQIYAGLAKCTDFLLGKSFKRDDGVQMKITLLHIDAGFEGDTVKEFCKASPHSALLMPSHGTYIGARSKPWSEYDRTRCEKMGSHWMIPKITPGAKTNRHVSVDVNFWKSFVAARLLTPVGDKGALTFFGKQGQDHKMIFDHLTSEYYVETYGRGRTLQEWMAKAGRDNHWWDGLVGCAVAASRLGCTLFPKSPSKPVKYSDLYEAARERERKTG